MNIPLRVIDFPEEYFETEVGDMWREPIHDVDGREAWTIHIPDDPSGPRPGRSDGKTWPNYFVTTQGYPDKMWDVSGDAPNITVTPSIFCSPPTGWHGWITAGEIVG